jgi:HSP20 family protein
MLAPATSTQHRRSATLNLMRWDPWGQDLRTFLRQGFDFPDAGFTPALDVVERENEVVVRCELPGVKPSDVDVSVHDGLLTIKGERRSEDVREGETWIRRESSYGKFERRLSLPKDTDPDGVSATYDAGVLSVTIPKPEKAQPRKIDVSVQGD